MKALAILSVCFVIGASTPSLALAIGGGPHAAAGPRVVQLPGGHSQAPGGHGQKPGDHGRPPLHLHSGALVGIDASGDVAVIGPAPDAEPAPPPPLVEMPPAVRCPAIEPTAARSSGPHIIYINHKPTFPSTPKVIYGTD